MKKGLTFVLILISSFFLIACGNERVKYLAEDFYSMNTIISITVPEEMKEDENYKNAHLEVREMFDFIHDLTDNFTIIESHKVINSIYDINDTLVNSSEQFHQFEINFELYEILQISQEMENLTDG